MADSSGLWIPVLPSMDEFGPALTKGVAKEAEKAGGDTGKRFGKALAVGAGTVAGVAAVGTALFGVGKTFQDMTNTIRTATGAAGDDLDGLVDTAKTIGTQIPVEFDVIGQAIGSLNTYTGAAGEDLEGLTESVLEASRMLGEDGAANAETFGKSLQLWQVPADEGAGKMDSLFVATQKYGVGLDEVMGHLNNYGPVLQNAGFSMEESAALFGQLEAGGISVSRVMPGLNKSFRDWAKEGKNSQEELSKTVAGIKEAETETEALTLATDTFGAEGAQRMMSAIRSGVLDLEDLEGALADSQGAVKENAEETRTFEESWQLFKNRTLEALAPAAQAVFDTMGAAMEGLADILATKVIPWFERMVGWIQDNHAWLVPLVSAVGALYAGYLLLTGLKAIAGWYQTTTVAQKGLNAAMRANPIGLIITILGLLVAAVIWAYNEVDWFRQIVDTAWSAISTAAQWAWDNVLNPVFSAISGFVTEVLGPVFTWLWENIISPVFSWIGDRVSQTWNGILKPIFGLLKDIIVNVVAPVIMGLWRDTVQPAFAAIGDFISAIWENGIRPALDAFGGFIEDKVAPGIQKGVDWIKEIWETVAGIFREPINWVLRTVWDDGIKAAFDTVAKAVGSDERLDPAPKIPAFARGGYHAGGWALVGEEGPELVNFAAPGRVYTAAQTAAALSSGRDLSPEEAARAAGSSPEEAVAPMGGWWGDVKDGLSSSDNMLGQGLAGVMDLAEDAAGWVVGRLAEGARGLLDPVLSGAQGFLSGFGGLGSLSGDWLGSIIDQIFGFAEDKDSAEGEIFDGPSGPIRRPSGGRITSWYGPRWGGHHAGIDFAGGGITRAAMDGLVQEVGWNIGPGRTGLGVRLNHGPGLWTYHGHNPVGGVAVSPGQRVKAGDPVGREGSTGNVTGDHLHWELHKGSPWADQNINALFRDDGGELPPGLSMILNDRPESEWIVNQPQVDDMAANFAARGSGGDVYEIYVTDSAATGDDIAEALDFHSRRFGRE